MRPLRNLLFNNVDLVEGERHCCRRWVNTCWFSCESWVVIHAALQPVCESLIYHHEYFKMALFTKWLPWRIPFKSQADWKESPLHNSSLRLGIYNGMFSVWCCFALFFSKRWLIWILSSSKMMLLRQDIQPPSFFRCQWTCPEPGQGSLAKRRPWPHLKVWPSAKPNLALLWNENHFSDPNMRNPVCFRARTQ